MSRVTRCVTLSLEADSLLAGGVALLTTKAPPEMRQSLGLRPGERVTVSFFIDCCIKVAVKELEREIREVTSDDGAAVHVAQSGAKPANKAARKANATGGLRKHKSVGKAAA